MRLTLNLPQLKAPFLHTRCTCMLQASSPSARVCSLRICTTSCTRRPFSPPPRAPSPPRGAVAVYCNTLEQCQRLKVLGCAMMGMLAVRLSQGSGGPESCNSPVMYRPPTP